MMELLDVIMKWLVAPVAGFAWVLYNRQQQLITQVAVLTRDVENNKNSHDKEMVETKDYLKGIMQKLDSIEAFLRK